MNKHKYAGFTLIEMLLTLFLVITFLMLPSIRLGKWLEQLRVNYFFDTFEKKLLYTQQMAIVLNQDTTVFLKEDDTIQYTVSNRHNDEQNLIIPKELTASATMKVVFKKQTGNNGYLAKFSFIWKEKKQQINYQFEMGSGRFTKKTVEL